jgi:uncharacterized surface protein with fasciclin (FAS1) repeats
MRIARTFTIGGLLLALSTAPALAGSHGAEKPAKNIVQVARDAGQFQTLIAALKATDLVGTLSGQGKGPFTVFAPTDAAFAKLPQGTLEALLADPVTLKSILLYHVVAGEYRAADVVGQSGIVTVNGQSVTITTAPNVKVNNANVTATDILARNGVIHVIDTVLLPQ